MARPNRNTIIRACGKPGPEDRRETFFAHELQNCFGVTANMLGRVAKEKKLKTNQNGCYVDALTPGGFYRPTFKYNINGLRALAAAFEDKFLLNAVTLNGCCTCPGELIARANYHNRLYGRTPEMLRQRYRRRQSNGRTILERW